MIPVNEGDTKCYACEFFYEAYGCIPTYNNHYPPCGRKVIGGKNMDNKAIQIVTDYIKDHLDKSDTMPDFEVFVVWKCKALQNWKYLMSSTLFDGMYYEITYNGDKKEFYFDAYKKWENVCIPYPQEV